MKKKLSVLLAAVMLITVPGYSVAAAPVAGPSMENASEAVSEEILTETSTEASGSEIPGGVSEKVSEETAKEETSKENASSEAVTEAEIETIEAIETMDAIETVEVASEMAAATPEETEEAYREAEESRAKIWDALAPYASRADFYDDVASDHWYTPGAGYCFSKGIITGLGDNLFGGAQNICRAQFITILYRMAGAPETPFEQIFADVSDGQFYSSAVTWGSKNQIINWEGDSVFRPADDLPRAGMVEMMYRYAKYCGVDTSLTIDLTAKYKDAGQVPEYANAAFQWAVRSGLISGTDETHLSPNDTCNRAECSTIIARFCERFFPGSFADVTFNASADISLKAVDKHYGNFTVKASNVTATHPVKEVKAQVWTADDYSDLQWVDLTYQEDGTYAANLHVSGWNFKTGYYKTQIFIYLQNGLRFYQGGTWDDVQLASVDWNVISAMKPEIREICFNIYDSVGYDLYECFQWVWNNVTWTADDPNGWGWGVPSHYTSTEWYSITAYRKRTGMCYCFSSLFFLLAKGLGYPAKSIAGYVPQADGTNADHGWVEIGPYMYDPSVGAYQFVYGTSGTYMYSGGQVIDE